MMVASSPADTRVFAVGRERQGVGSAAMAGQLAQLAAGVEIPKADGVVPACRSQRAAVRRESDEDRRILVAFKEEPLLAGRSFPDRDGLRASVFGQRCPIW